MFRQAMSNKCLVAGVAVAACSLFVTIRVFSDSWSCQASCQKACSGPPPEEEARDVPVPPWEQDLDFQGFNNETGTPDGHYIVPNYVHFIKFGQPEFNFVHAVCVLAAFKNQKPEKIFFHTDLDAFKGLYWDVILNTTGFKEALIIRKIEVPTQIFGQKLQWKWKNYHGGDVARLEVMMEYGGIYLDSDSYVVRSLDDFRRYEMALGWLPGKDMGNQILVAHKNARFLRLWYESYRNNYDPNSWYYNAGTYATEHILDYQPYLIHRVEKLFGVYGIKWKTYMTDFPEWRDYYTFHLLSSRLHIGLKDPTHRLKYPVVFDHENILDYPVAFREMCKAVYPFPNRT